MLLLLALFSWCAAEFKPLSSAELVSADRHASQDTRQEKSHRAPEGSSQNDLAIDPSKYVGVDTCKSCHDDEFKSYENGAHSKRTLDKHKGPQWQGCEACHGPGKEHAESADPSMIISFPSLSREESSMRCLSCHEFAEEHASFLGSQHLKNNIGCLDCHSVHSPKVNGKILKSPQPALCYTCHLQVKPESSEASHHGVKGGLNQCTNCHNPHGGLTKRNLSEAAAKTGCALPREVRSGANTGSKLPR